MTGRAKLKNRICLALIALLICITHGFTDASTGEALLLVDVYNSAIGISGGGEASPIDDGGSYLHDDKDEPNDDIQHLGSSGEDDETEHLGSSGEGNPSDAHPPVNTQILPEITTTESLGNWTNYNGLIFGNADIYDSQSGGGLAVGGRLSFHTDIQIGSTYTSEYDPTMHIGEYQNLAGVPALLLGGNTLTVDPDISFLDVFGGTVTMTPDMTAHNNTLATGITPRTDSAFQPAGQDLLNDWFEYQHKIAEATSQLMLLANDELIELAALGDGSYLSAGPERFQNKYLEVNGAVYENALFITVKTENEVNFGQWWPVMSLITIDVDWAIDYDLLVFNFPDAVNVTMNSSTFSILNMQHWSTTVDAWVGDRGALERHALAEKVVYNFPNAGSVEASQTLIQGSVLAPNATFTGIGQGSNGHIYGHIVAQNIVLRNGFTIHAFELTHWIYDIVENAVSNQVDTGDITLRHYLYFQGEPTTIRTAGGEFLLERADGTYYNGSGEFSEAIEHAMLYSTVPGRYTLIQDVPVGEYTLITAKEPQGFRPNLSNIGNPATFYRYPLSITEKGEVVHAVRYSEPDLIDIPFRKVDAQTGEGLPGAVFTLVREADEYHDATIGGTFISDGNGNFTCSSVPVGRYHLVEVSIPEDHTSLASGEFPFVVEWDMDTGYLAVRSPEGETYTATDDNPVPVPNQTGTSQNIVTIVKYEADPEEPETYHPLPGAAFSLFRYDEDIGRWEALTQTTAGDPITIVTNEYGYYRVENLPMGDYRITETKAPPGYALSNPHTDLEHEDIFPHGYAYSFSFNGSITFYTAYIPGTPLFMDIVIRSHGSPFGEDTPLSGTAFRLEHLLEDGLTWEELIYSIQTNGDGQVTFEGLEAGQYQATLLSPTTGYSILDPPQILFSISFNDSSAPEFEAAYNNEPVTIDTHPVSLDFSDGTSIVVTSEARTSNYLVYKLDGEVQTGTDEQGIPTYAATYLEGAGFRLRRRTTTRMNWQDYGGSFYSELLYDEDDNPVTDSYGNHIAAAIFPGGLLFGEYQLVETTPPEGYNASSGIPIVFDDGETGFQTHLFIIALGMTGGGQTATYTAFDYPIRYTSSLRFRTVDSGNYSTPVSGAEFALYYCGEPHRHDEFLTADSCWANSTPIIEISNANGIVIFEDLVSGDYLLRENQAPAQYQLPNTFWLADVDAENGTISLSATDSASYDFIPTDYDGVDWLLPNRRQFALPVTGGSGTAAFFLIGSLLLTMAVVFFIRIKIQNKSGNEEKQ